MKRPLVCFSLSLIAGIICTNLTYSYLFAVLSCAIISIIVFVLLKDRDNSKFIIGGIVLFYIVGAVYYLYGYNRNLYKYEEFAGKNVIIRGYIDSAPEIRDSTIRYILKTEEIWLKGDSSQKKKVRGKILISMQKSDDTKLFEYGREIRISGKINIPKGRTNPGGFDYRKYLNHSGVSATIFVVDRNIYPQKSVKGNIFVKAGLGIRERIVNVINQSLPPQQAGLLNGMLIGYREGLSKEVEDAFSNSGLTHLMAVSGANIAFIMLPLIFIFKKLKFRQNIYNIIIIGILVMFTFITGFEPSVLRAVIMAIIILVGQILKRETDIFTSIAFAAILLLLLNPGSLFNIGFQLSFAATISLVLFYSNLKNMLSFGFLPEFITDVLASTLAAQIGVLPITVFYFNKISLVSILSNLIVAPIVEFITIMGSLMALLGQIHIIFSVLIGFCNNALLSFVLFVTKTTAELPYSVITVSTPSIALVIVYYIVILFLFWYRPKHKTKLNYRYCALAGAVTVMLIALSIFWPRGMEVVFLDVGQGDGAFIRTYRGKTVLIDGGPENAGENSVVPFLLDYGAAKIDLVVVTHGHDDHYKGLLPVLENFKVENLIIPDVDINEGFSDALEIAQKRKIPVEKCEKGDVITLDKRTYIEVLHPKKGAYFNESDVNNNSLVLKLNFKDVSILFTGDIEKEAERLLCEDGVDLSADVLKVAHHGSLTSSTEEFLDSVNPDVAVISVGKNNFGHPSKEVLERMDIRDIYVLRTDMSGALVLKTYGEKIRIRETVP
ncbi:DNA internalization-related competence protein ComEC/Rec2 [Acetivibrio straminisolvens]|jgi:competence protein ComEC|uniref:DNA internalization-related competence protein ComEC/Rec2 n=1 Tax=Acetivibrio straminisolvens TaxID=253314 RepID=UPI00223F4140|nr:DNA internalization-related competence protein ComEC/Rec2 [Acetivibrio straminisolvens]